MKTWIIQSAGYVWAQDADTPVDAVKGVLSRCTADALGVLCEARLDGMHEDDGDVTYVSTVSVLQELDKYEEVAR